MKVSVIMPTYNRLGLLKRAIKSFLAQDYENSELIILENGCTDGTKEYLKSISNPRIKVINNEVNKILGSLNVLWNAAQGDLICQLHDDDQLTWFGISKRVERFIQDKNLEVCYGGWNNVNFEGKDLGFYKGQASNPARILANEYINFTTMMWKNELKKKFMFDEDLFYYVDWHFKIRCAMECTMTCVEESVMNYTIHKGQESVRCRLTAQNAPEQNLMRKKIKEVYGGLFL
jgi:glycosyltransferase involved in cell wall biosynthesis